MKELNYNPNIGFLETQIGYLRNHNQNSPLKESFEKMIDNKIDFFEVCELLHTNYNDLYRVFPNAPIGDLTLKIFKVINSDFALAKSSNSTVVAISVKDCMWQQQSRHYYGSGKKPHIKVSTFIKEGEAIVGTNFSKTQKGWKALWLPTTKAIEKAYATRVCDL
jgi:hypothetical protein